MNLFSWFNNQVVLGLLRNIILSVGTGLGVTGLFTPGTWEEIVGVIIMIVSGILSGVSNNTKSKAVAIEKAVEAHPKLTVIPAEESATGKPKIAVSIAT